MSSYYGLFFLAIGSFAPFAALWFNSQNISSSMTGAIFAAPAIATVLLTIFIGGWADRLADWRNAIIICNWGMLITLSWILIARGPWVILMIWTVAGLLARSGAPIMDAAALHLTKKRGSDFGRVRSFGSMGFIVGVLAAGWLFDRFGIQWFVAVLLFTAALRVVGAHMLPRFRADRELSQATVTTNSALFMLQHPGILLVLIGSALIAASHGFNNVFSIMHWTNVGISTSMASTLWSVGVLAEVALMWSFKSVAKKFSARYCLLLASAVCVVRWFLTGTDPGLAQLFVLQAMHSITFGLTFLATVNFIARRVHEDHAAQAQSVYAMLSTLAIALATWSSGWFYDQYAGQSYWAMSLLALLGGVGVAWSFRSDLDDPVET